MTDVTQSFSLKLLDYAERHGINMGGLFLLVGGIVGGQYAKLFPDQLQEIAGWFCLLVAASGLVSVMVHLVLGWFAARASGTSSPSVAKANTAKAAMAGGPMPEGSMSGAAKSE